jgi:serine/threonine protein phosphatase PrpC
MPFVTAWTNRLGNRSHNQDRCLVLEAAAGKSVLLAVADGMGGHARGDLAAQTAIDSLRRSFISARGKIADPAAFLEQAISHAHLDVVDTGRAQRPPLTPRTTCVVCLVQGDYAWWAHLGDSRLYLVRDGRIICRTRDHTPVEEMVQNGLLTDDSLRNHPMRNSVSRCLGGGPVLPKISSGETGMQHGDTLLLCSDGLWSALDEQRLCDLPADAGELERRVNQLTDEADVASYPHSDNISLVGLRWLAEEQRQTAARPTPGSDASRPATEPADSSDPADPLQEAIDDIHRALLEYAGEMKK